MKVGVTRSGRMSFRSSGQGSVRSTRLSGARLRSAQVIRYTAVLLFLIGSVLFTAGAYITGILGLRYIGATVGSFVNLIEVPFSVIVAWLLLAELPAPIQLFGGVFEQIESELRGQSPLDKAAERLAGEVEDASGSASNLASATETAAQRILRATDPLAAISGNAVDRRSKTHRSGTASGNRAGQRSDGQALTCAGIQ